MSAPTTAMLFAPPQPPVQLAGDAPCVIGRGRDCDVRLGDPDTSRRHAELRLEGERFVLRDLGSTNGTWVNGERVDRIALTPGDRLEIGANQITFCEVQAGVTLPEVDEAQTLLFERPAGAGDAFRGDLAQIPPFAVLQILELGRKTGLLRIDADSDPGQLWLEAGQPVHAETKSQAGFDAALALVAADAGRFVFEPRLELPETTIQASVTQLLLEASRRMDEAEL